MIFSRMVGGLGNQLFQTAAFLKYRKKKEKVIISFLGDIHKPKRENCLNYIFESPNWLYYDNTKNLNYFIKLFARSSAGLRFGSYIPFFGINDRNFKRFSKLNCRKLLFLDGYFHHNWTFEELNPLLSELKLKTIKLHSKQLKICKEGAVIHIRGGDFLKIKNLNICKAYYYKKCIKYALEKGIKTFKVICEDQKYGKEIIKEIKNYFSDLNISLLDSNTIRNDFGFY